MNEGFLQFHHKYHKDIPSEGNNPKPQQLYIKVFMPRGNLHKVEYKKNMHGIDTCYRNSIGDDEDENFCLSSKLDSNNHMVRTPSL